MLRTVVAEVVAIQPPSMTPSGPSRPAPLISMGVAQRADRRSRLLRLPGAPDGHADGDSDRINPPDAAMHAPSMKTGGA